MYMYMYMYMFTTDGLIYCGVTTQSLFLYLPSFLPGQVPDYYDIIDNPMDLSTIMKRIDEHQYSIPSQWLKDIDLITKNALEYVAVNNATGDTL